jgi:hypothetical protein
MGIPVPLFWLRTFYVEFRWSPDEVHLESRYIEYKYANSSIFQVDSRWTPDGYWSPAGVHLNSVGECKVYEKGLTGATICKLISVFAVFIIAHSSESKNCNDDQYTGRKENENKNKLTSAIVCEGGDLLQQVKHISQVCCCSRMRKKCRAWQE